MPSKELRLLSLDGGGVRGLSSLYILRNLMEKIDPEASEPPKPCDYFDMIGGTSTGGLIAIMLGRLEMSVDQCIKAYTSLSEEIFSKESKSRFRFSFKGDLKSRFDAGRLKKAIIKVLNDVDMGPDTLLSSPNAKCKVFVCATGQKNEIVTLKSYTSPRDNRRLGYVKIWEACRATSAAQGFFDPIHIPPGKESELFTDGGIRANNPVKELWGQACDLWATSHDTSQDSQLRSQLKCLVSIGTGRPDLTAYSTSLRGVMKVLTKIATDTEAVAENFARERPELLRDGQYFRFNVDRGLKGIGLDECDRLSEITSSTTAYLETQAVFSSLRSCADILSGRSVLAIAHPKDFRIPFKLDGIIHTDTFVSRPQDTARIEEVLLRQDSEHSRIFVLHGMGGIGKTQLAINFATVNRNAFSSVFWLQGQTEESLRESLVRSAKRIPRNQISDTSRRACPTNEVERQEIIDDVLAWLASEDNHSWLLVFDNVDLDPASPGDQARGAYRVTDYIPGNHGSVLITTRLESLAQIGSGRSSDEVTTVDQKISKSMFEKWYGSPLSKPTMRSLWQEKATDGFKEDDEATRDLLGPLRLGGLPLAIAQAAVYMKQNRGMSISEYTRRFDSMWPQVMGTMVDRPLYNYHGAVGITWALSMEQVREKNEEAAKLAQIWAFLDNSDFGFYLLRDMPEDVEERILSADEKASYNWKSIHLPEWFTTLGKDEARFYQYLSLLQNYRLAIIDGAYVVDHDQRQEITFSMHPVVHRWAMTSQTEEERRNSLFHATWIFAVQGSSPRLDRVGHMETNRRLEPHILKCLSGITEDNISAICSHIQSLAALVDILASSRVMQKEVIIQAFKMTLWDSGNPRLMPSALHTFCSDSYFFQLVRFGHLEDAELLLRDSNGRGFDPAVGDLKTLFLAEVSSFSDPHKAILLLNELISICAVSSFASIRAKLRLGTIYRRRDDLVSAESYLRDAVALSKAHQPQDSVLRVDAEVEMGIIQLMEGVRSPETGANVMLETKRVMSDAYNYSFSKRSGSAVSTQRHAALAAFALTMSGQLEEAEVMLQCTFSKGKTTIPTHTRVALILLACTYADKGNATRALEVVQDPSLTASNVWISDEEKEWFIQKLKTENAPGFWQAMLQKAFKELYTVLQDS